MKRAHTVQPYPKSSCTCSTAEANDPFFFTGWTWRHVRARPFSIAHKDRISTRTITDDRTNPTLIAYEFEEPLAALISSSARHSAIDFTLRNADSRVYVTKMQTKTQTQTQSERGPRGARRRSCLHRWSGARSPGSLSVEGTRRRPDDGPYLATRYASSLLEDQC